MKLTFAFSPCPNDTFMFEPIVNKRIDLEGLTFDIQMDDVEKLNKSAFNTVSDITKLSFNAFTQLSDIYQLLDSGSALGRGCGPLLVSKNKLAITEVDQSKIAIPGINTTAYLLLKYAFPNIKDTKEMIFSTVEDSVLSGQCDAGLIIHENRFTYQTKGLFKVMDLGQFWETQTGFPIPLGGIVVKRDMHETLKQKINRIIARSVNYAFDNKGSGMDYIRLHAQETDDDVITAHISLYVNEFSKDLGVEGRNAVKGMFTFVHPEMSTIQLNNIFVTNH